jgi:D-amino peptidase
MPPLFSTGRLRISSGKRSDTMARKTSILVLVILLSAGAAVLAQRKPMKVFISADMEGIAGVVDASQTSSANRDYHVGRRLMLAEVNAAVAGAFEAGAAEVHVADAHGSMTNLEPDQLNRGAVLITGSPRPYGMMQGLDETFTAVVFIGYHAQASTMDGVLDHTYNGQLKSVKLNGKEVGEYGLNAALAGHYGVPVAFLSGDRAVCDQARAFIPAIDTLEVKQGIGPTAARTMHPQEAREKITAGVRAALMRQVARPPVQLTKPVTIEIELSNSAQADSAMMVPGMKRLSGRSVSYEAPDMRVAYSISRLVARLSTSN